MDWQISSRGRKSSRSEEAFVPGDRVVSMLTVGDGGLLERIDLHASEEPEWTGPEALSRIARWEWTVPEPDTRERDELRQRLDSADALFLSLQTEDDPEADPGEATGQPRGGAPERTALRYLLGAFLERKRRIKRLKPSDVRERELDTSAGNWYLHVTTEQPCSIPKETPDPEIIARIRDQLTALVQ